MSNDVKPVKATLSEITAADLDAVSVFLHKNMNDKFSPEQWKKGISVNWLADAPNHGFLLKSDNEIVGVLCAIYSEQYVWGEMKPFCNPHTWCVLPDHRKRSVDLVLATIRQQGYHYTMFSPNKEGVEIFAYLRFKPMDKTVSILLNVPTPGGSGTTFSDNPEQALEMLSARDAACYREHMQFPWLNFLAFSKNGKSGFIIYKKQKLKKLPCANILYVSDSGLFEDCWPAIRTHLLLKHGFVTSKIEQRLINNVLAFTLKQEPGHQRFFLSNELSERDITYIYSELMTLDI